MRKNWILVFVISFLLLSFSALSVDAQRVDIDVKKSSIEWTGRKLAGEHYGNISLTSGQFVFSGNHLSGGSFQIDMNSITCIDITDQKSNKRLVDHLKSDDFFSVTKHPEAKFEITSVEFISGRNYNITGNLTIKGVSHPLTFPATITTNETQIIAEANMVFDRSKYGIKFGSQSFFENLGDKLVYDDVEMKVKLVGYPPISK